MIMSEHDDEYECAFGCKFFDKVIKCVSTKKKIIAKTRTLERVSQRKKEGVGFQLLVM